MASGAVEVLCNLFEAVLIKFSQVGDCSDALLLQLFPGALWECHLVGVLEEGGGLGGSEDHDSAVVGRESGR